MDDSDDDDNIAISSSDEHQLKKRKKSHKIKPAKKQKRKNRKNATQKQKEMVKAQKELERKQGKNGLALIKRWRCDSSSCDNRGHHCWQPEGKANTYIKLFDVYIAQWNKAISRGTDDASVDEPHKRLKMLLYEWQKQQSETPKVKKERSDKKEDDEAEKKERIEAPAKETPLWIGQMVSPMLLPGFQMSGSLFQNPWQQIPP